MTTRVEIETLILIIMAAIFGVVFAFYTNKTPRTRTVFNLPAIETADIKPIVTPISDTQTFSQTAPDGTKVLNMKVTANKDGTKTYVFTASDESGANQQNIHTVTLAKNTMSIPYNTWSPDNKYVFLQYNTTSGNEAWIFRANGKPMTNIEQYYNSVPLFLARNTGNAYQEITGWASETLLIINTKRADYSKGPSYWLEIPSKAIIQLSTEF